MMTKLAVTLALLPGLFLAMIALVGLAVYGNVADVAAAKAELAPCSPASA